MNEKETFIALFRKMMNWEWYTDVPVKTLFLHCILRANYYDNMFRGKLIKRGSFTTSLNELSIQTGLTIKQIRNAFTKLEKTNEIIKKGANTHTLVTVVNYDKYQLEDKSKGKQDDNQKTNEGQTKGKQRATNNKVNKENKVNNNTLKENKKEKFVIPTVEEVELFCKENDLDIDSQYFIDYYNSNGWCVGRQKMKDWKATARNWDRRANPNKKKKPLIEEPEMSDEEYQKVLDNIDRMKKQWKEESGGR